MSDVADDQEFRAEQLLNKSKTHRLREQMRAFLADHDEPADLESLRRRVSGEKDLSDIVVDDRDERV
jgi:membrane-bound lytic murein transglycosylase MltF